MEKADCSTEIGYFPYLYIAEEIRELCNGKLDVPWQYCPPPPQSQNRDVKLVGYNFLR